MFKSIYSTGAIVKVLMGVYNHYAVVSDRYDNGKPMLISLSAKQGTVCEEAWDYCVENRKVVLSPVQGNLQPHQVVQRARSKLGKIKYSPLSRNCEHFARWAHDLKVERNKYKELSLLQG